MRKPAWNSKNIPSDMSKDFQYPYPEKILTYAEAEDAAAKLKSKGEKIVLVSGSFDIVHLGHVQFLKDAKAYGDRLFVCVATDDTIARIKGPGRPITAMEYRASMLASLIPVDFAVLQEEPLIMPERINFEKLLSILRPDFFVVNNTDKSIPHKRQLVEKYGGALKIVDVESSAITSTTEIVKKIYSL